MTNAKRSFKDYMVYIVTMSIVATLMFAFNGLMFSPSMMALYGDITEFIVLTAMGDFFISFCMIWLVGYIINFMLKKRSKEFANYMLFGIFKKKISKMFRRENMLLGMLSLVIGFLPSILFQIIFVNVFYAILDTPYQIKVEVSWIGIVLTVCIFAFAYLIALWRVKSKFKKMNIRKLLDAEKQNEQVQNPKNSWQKIFAVIAVVYIIIFNVFIFTSQYTIENVWFYILGLIIAIYLFYIGISPMFVSYIEKKKNGVYKGTNLFIFRQLASKIKTMRVTMGTLTILFSLTLLSWMVVIMFGGFLAEFSGKVPIDVTCFSANSNETFEQQKEIIGAQTDVEEEYEYKVYHNNTTILNEYLLNNISGAKQSNEYMEFGGYPSGAYYNSEEVSGLGGYSTGTDAYANMGEYSTSTYYKYDTYMLLSDYNKVREMAGYEPISLQGNQFIIQSNLRANPLLKKYCKEMEITIGDKALEYGGAYTEEMMQSGINGADYIIVVPDNAKKGLEPLYSILAVNLASEAPSGLAEELKSVEQKGNAMAFSKGTDGVLNYSSTIIVKDNLTEEFSFILVSLMFVLVYIGIVFFCMALTILAVQQLSDASKFKYRYDILWKLGLSTDEVNKTIFTQLSLYYGLPLVITLLLSSIIGFFANQQFVYYTNVNSSSFAAFLLAIAIFLVFYIIYFALTYLLFQKNIKEKE